eukprot:scaffold23779_cov112-Isochrysis_galbana.AAC.6
MTTLAACAPAVCHCLDLGRMYPDHRRVSCVLELTEVIRSDFLNSDGSSLNEAQLSLFFNLIDAALPALLCGSAELSESTIEMLEVRVSARTRCPPVRTNHALSSARRHFLMLSRGTRSCRSAGTRILV